MTTTTMTAILSTEGWHVTDSQGGTWWPSSEAEAEILASDNPAATAVDICDSEPHRGSWHS